jgi:hypothetical protein
MSNAETSNPSKAQPSFTSKKSINCPPKTNDKPTIAGVQIAEATNNPNPNFKGLARKTPAAK